MKIKRMPVSTWSVRGFLAGRKSRTSRLMKPRPPDDWVPGKCLIADNVGEGFTFYGTWAHEGHEERGVFRQRYQVGEIVAMGEALLAREVATPTGPQDIVTYAADACIVSEPLPMPVRAASWRWKRRTQPSIFMPLWAARRWLRITDVRAELAEDISEEDALAEGLVHGQYMTCGSSLDGGSCVGRGWQASDGEWYPTHTAAWIATLRDHNPKMKPGDNPWLFAYTLEQVDKPKGEGDAKTR